MNDELANLLPVSEVGRLLGLSAQRVRVLIDQGHLPATRTALGRLVAASDVEAFRCHRDAFGRYRVATPEVKKP
jgi:excisionase family DNA binding protein